MSERCAYLVSRYPLVTHTFIAGEIRELRRRGVHVETATVRRTSDVEIVSDADRAERDATHVLVTRSPVRLLDAHARALARAPRRYAATLARALRSSHAGGRARLWQLFYFGEAILLWRWMQQRDLRHVHVHHANVAADVAMLACGYAGWTWSLTVHGPTELLDMEAHKLAMKARDAAAVACISDFARSQVTAVAPDANLHTVRMGIDTGAFAPAARDDHDGFEVLCVASLQPRKGIGVLLDAVAQVPAARLVVAGDGEEAPALHAQAQRLGIGDRVEWVGAVAHDRVVELCRRADAFCLPSFAEGVPTVLMEAMATGLPVVATAVGGTSELVDEILVAPARADLIAEGLRRLADEPDLRRELGKRGRERVLADYDRVKNVARLHELLAPWLTTTGGP